MNYQKLQQKFLENQNQVQALQMKKYMRNQFDFYGYHSADRKEIYHQDLLAEKKKKQVDWELLERAWNDSHRELQYFVCDYLIAMKKFLKFEDLPKLRHFILQKSWWDTIDSLIKPIGYLGLKDNRVGKEMLKWSKDSNFWIRRTAIEHQLLRKEKMDTELLKQIIKNNFNSEEFFINKAIGWALRDYSKTNPAWVKEFLGEYKNQMAPLSIKEASKYLDD
ncbi:DNA alkylation repair protein [Lactobacillus sp. PV037]|uniref:DNA alkylation repair protein n=1 Tax=Lactobacillus sp. PV037 TaxID=2594496 RepID=UPI00223EF7E5|nr:DNA alkylation repair protein [Lactobacillus sp. PV037]QNQ83264.1 DNA alkylation repair protein [Lactobacillus sp. PV037]